MRDAYEQQRKLALREMARLVDAAEFDPHMIAREEAIKQLGSKWLLHPSNRVQRRTTPYGSAK
ncbi:hypothetical protein [Caballeronia sp. LZ001]|uniref:hypothetical protein n=1 Tax=Caballeronia sp. LZ001 TaxID=3038553 RepID=UPI00286398D4|nr:hypothetical protein [Caballeronia sp. LZ001]MDR5802164.1 hypothetical protein [Caballeronia sp. LZ001]